MKNYCIILLFCFSVKPIIAQVGINTTSPNAQLEIKSSNEVTPSNTDGILIPKVNAFPATNPTIAQQGMLVYLKNTSGANLPGFYYWDNATLSWKGIASGFGWSLTGNSGTNAASNFIGTTDDIDLIFRRNNIFSGKITTTNTSFGYRSLLSITTGTGNTAHGVNTLRSNTTGDNNTAYGESALRNNTTGSNNTANGNSALFSNTTGGSNTANGENALRSNTTGSNNTAIGSGTLNRNTSGGSNTANGVDALRNNTIGFRNTASGFEALNRNTTGGDNTANGVNALRSNTIGVLNTANGVDALRTNTSGGHNTANGANALFANTTGGYNTATGFDVLSSNTTGSYNTANGEGALSNNTTGRDNVAFGQAALATVTTGRNNIGIGTNAQVPSATGNNRVRIGNTAITYAGVQVGWSITSDKRWKSNIQKSNLGLDFIKQLNPVFYTRKDVVIKEGKTTILETTSNPITEYGFIAQELESTLSRFNTINNGIISKDDAGMYGVRYNDLIAPLVKAVQEQQVIIEELKEKIEKLENK